MAQRLREPLPVIDFPAGQVTSGQTELFAEGLCFYKLVWIFGFGCLLGFLIETVIVLLFQGAYSNRAGMVWGPFNQVYGFGAVLLSLVLVPMSAKSNTTILIVGTLLGGVFEFFCSLVQEKAFNTVSWDYTDNPTSIGGRTNLGYMLFWGALALVYVRFLYPLLSALIERFNPVAGAICTWVVLVFFTLNLLVSALSVTRWNERTDGIEATNPVALYLDENYPDARMESIYPEMIRIAEQKDDTYGEAA